MRKYTEEEKEHARECLNARDGDVPFVALETGIPERTLYRWKRQWQKNNSSLPHDSPNHGISWDELQERIHKKYPTGEYTQLRQQLMQHIQALTPTLSEDPDLAHRRVLALTRLLDRVIKLEELTPNETVLPFVISYETPDGLYHNQPYYRNDLHMRAQEAYDAVIAHARAVWQEKHEIEPLPQQTSDTLDDDFFTWDGQYNQGLRDIFERPFTDKEFGIKPDGSYEETPKFRFKDDKNARNDW